MHDNQDMEVPSVPPSKSIAPSKGSEPGPKKSAGIEGISKPPISVIADSTNPIVNTGINNII